VLSFSVQQSARWIVHLVSEPAKVNALHSLAQLQVDYTESDTRCTPDTSDWTLLLLHAGLYGEKDAWYMKRLLK